MSDARLQDLERAWEATGDLDAHARVLRERMRAGELPEGHLYLAARLGHKASQLATGVSTNHHPAAWAIEFTELQDHALALRVVDLLCERLLAALDSPLPGLDGLTGRPRSRPGDSQLIGQLKELLVDWGHPDHARIEALHELILWASLIHEPNGLHYPSLSGAIDSASWALGFEIGPRLLDLILAPGSP